MPDLLAFDEITVGHADLVGGKGLSLALLSQTGLPVPPGFCITTEVFLRLRGRQLRDDPALVQQIGAACARLGGGPLAVRSSALGEDETQTSFAGQHRTVLGVAGEAQLLAAIEQCWSSLDSEPAVAYRRRQDASRHRTSAMAVVVQRLVAAEVAGVLFTRDPFDPRGEGMLIEASWGLGESIASGRLTPDAYRLDFATGKLLGSEIRRKQVRLTPAGLEDVPVESQLQACLDEARLRRLAELGRRIEAIYGAPRDVEWAWAEGRFWILQARPITAVTAAQREQVRRDEMARLQARAAPGGTVWSRYNLCEVLPEPTPMTWAVIQRFLSGSGGFGRMYRDLGFEPAAELADRGVYDLVCGRPYCNLSLEPGMYSNGLPFEHPFGALKGAPDKALYPRAALNWSRAGWRFWLFLPLIFWKSFRVAARIQRQTLLFGRHFREQIIPAFDAEVKAALGQDLAVLDNATLLGRLDYWIERVLVEFARDSLKPTVLAAIVLGNLEKTLVRLLGAEQGRSALKQLTLGVHPDPEADVAQAVQQVAEGRLDPDEFLGRFGHRGDQEMELSRPRWSEDRRALERLFSAATVAAGQAGSQVAEGCAEPAIDNLPATVREEAQRLRDFLALRETAKHYLVTGYAQVRRILVELGRRFNLDQGVFFLVPEELPRLLGGEDFSQPIAQRRRRRTAELNLQVPAVLFSDDLEAIGRAVAVSGKPLFQGVAISPGVAEGPALVLSRPDARLTSSEPYILVCPSTDPAWVPLFLNARGLVMESGGVLSHGAIVAREFGLPAIAGLPGIGQQLRTGQRLRVDGTSGSLAVLE